MGRPERPVNPGSGPVAELAAALRELRRTAGKPSYRRLATRAHFSPATLARAAAGNTLPSLEVTLAYATACGAQRGMWEQRWRQARDQAEGARLADHHGRVAGLESGGASERALPRPAQLPVGPVHFVGRDVELRLLDDAAATAHAAASPVLIVTGMAGVGKTALAMHWGRRAAARYPDGQLYVDLRGYTNALPPLCPAEALARFLRALGIAAEHIPGDADEAAALYRSLLADRRILVVLDNADSAEQIRPLLPGGTQCTTVITSRDRLAGLAALHDARLLPLEALSLGEAVDLLGRILAGSAASRTERSALARACACLPLALRIAAANITTRGHGSIQDYLAALSESAGLDVLQLPGDQQAAMRAAFDLSYVKLKPDLQHLFRRFGLLPGRDLTASGAAVLASLQPAQAARALAALSDRCLVLEEKPGRYTLHDLLRRYARERAHREEDPVQRGRAIAEMTAWYATTAAAAARVLFPQMTRLPANPADSGPFDDGATALTWLDAERDNLVAVASFAAGSASKSAAWQLADALRGYFWLRRCGPEWLVVATSSVAAADADGDHHARAAALMCLADAHSQLGPRRQAAEEYARAGGHAELANWPQAQVAILSNLGGLEHEMGRPRHAITHYLRALHMDQPLGRGAPTVHSNLGRAYTDMGEYAAAEHHLIRALELYPHAGRSASPAKAHNNLGVVRHLLANYDAALTDLHRALELFTELGDVHGQIEALVNVADTDRERGHPRTALDHATRALHLARLSSDPTDQSKALTALAAIHHQQGRHPQAANLCRQALALADTDDAYQQITALLGLSRAHLALGEAKAAQRHCAAATTLISNSGFARFASEANQLQARILRRLRMPVQK